MTNASIAELIYQDLCESDEVTSPAEYPDHVLVDLKGLTQLLEKHAGWQPIEEAPPGVEVLGWYPKHPLDDDGYPTDAIDGGTSAIVKRHHGGGWEEPQWLDASGDFFGDDFCWAAEPTHWMPLPHGPSQEDRK